MELSRSPSMSQADEEPRNYVNSEPMLKFRNYKPQTSFLDGLYTEEQAEPETIQHLIQDKLDLLAADEDHLRYRINPKLMEPKKIDFDLKRRIEKKLDKLERETKKSIARHIKNSRSK